ncbi:MAG: hypothetical protein OEY59_13775 [Deltaproteobacteria bacterium]|nr:hypothetical protein [Deltaproteobacteria bacterium]
MAREPPAFFWGQGVMGGLFLGTLLGLLQKECLARGCENPLHQGNDVL